MTKVSRSLSVASSQEHDASFDDVSLHFTDAEMAQTDLFKLEDMIRKSLAENLSSVLTDGQYSVSDDIFRSRTLHLSMCLDALSVSVIDSLRAFLRATAPRHRLQMVVFGDIMDGKSLIGASSFYVTKVVIEETLWQQLTKEQQGALRSWCPSPDPAK